MSLSKPRHLSNASFYLAAAIGNRPCESDRAKPSAWKTPSPSSIAVCRQLPVRASVRRHTSLLARLRAAYTRTRRCTCLAASRHATPRLNEICNSVERALRHRRAQILGSPNTLSRCICGDCVYVHSLGRSCGAATALDFPLPLLPSFFPPPPRSSQQQQHTTTQHCRQRHTCAPWTPRKSSSGETSIMVRADHVLLSGALLQLWRHSHCHSHSRSPPLTPTRRSRSCRSDTLADSELLHEILNQNAGLVLARVGSYPPWPARVRSSASLTLSLFRSVCVRRRNRLTTVCVDVQFSEPGEYAKMSKYRLKKSHVCVYFFGTRNL